MAVDVYVKHKILLRLFGVSAEGEKRKWMIYYVKFNYLALSIIFPVIFVQFFLGCIWLSQYSAKAKSYAITGVITAWSAFSKLQILYYNRETINRLMKATNGYKVTTVTGKITYVCSIVYELLALSFRTWSLLDTVVKRPKKFIMPFWLPFDSPETSLGLFLMFAYFQVTMILKTITNFATDSLFLHISNQICERLYILKNTFEILGYTQEEKKEIQKTKLTLPIHGLKDEEILKLCVKEHVEILNLIYSMSSILDKLFVPLSFMSFTNMLFVFFLLNSADDLVSEIIKVAPWTILFFSQILVMCWAGELIKKRCSDLYFAVYNNRWYESNTKLKKSYLIIESFSLKPVILRGAFVFELSLQTYETIIRQVFSTFTVMIQVLNTK